MGTIVEGTPESPLEDSVLESIQEVQALPGAKEVTGLRMNSQGPALTTSSLTAAKMETDGAETTSSTLISRPHLSNSSRNQVK
jgi:hypothetical protein